MNTFQKGLCTDQSFWSKTLNEQLADIHRRIQAHIPEINRISFALYDQHTDLLKTYADSSTNDERLTHYEYPLAELPSLKHSASHHIHRHIKNITENLQEENQHNHWLKSQGFGSSLAIPTYIDELLVGFIFINSEQRELFDTKTVNLLDSYINLMQEAASKEIEIIHTVLDAAEYALQRKPKHRRQVRDHQTRMYFYAKLIALEISDIYQLDDEFIHNITIFSRFHDIGKLSIPSKVLQNPHEFGRPERNQIQAHIEEGISIIKDVICRSGCCSHSCLNVLIDIISYHQERLDGSGYPFGLQNSDIPISAQIIGVANIFDALTSHRPYKQARSVPFALLELEKMVAEGKINKHCVNALRDHQDYLNEIISRYPEAEPTDFEPTPE